jgi:hypothetical protein
MSESKLFNSLDFQKFLQDNNDFLNKREKNTKDKTSANSSVSSDSLNSNMFKSKDSFSNMFKSRELPSLDHITEDDRFRSKDWVALQNLGNHVDVSYSPAELFSSESESDCCKKHAPQEADQEQSADLEQVTSTTTTTNTNWGDFFFSQLHPPPEASVDSSVSYQVQDPNKSEVIRIPADNKARRQKASTKKPKKEGAGGKPLKKAPPQKADILGKEYVEPTDLDVLLGRGGKSNHHPGNKRYREEIRNFRSSYLALKTKEEKTDMTHFVVNYVHQYNGRFLALDKTTKPLPRWYVVSNARRKVSQALRENEDPAKRAEKRARFLKKKRAKALKK